MPLRFYAVFASLLLAVSASAAPYKGVGGQIEAYGTVAATFHTGQKAAEMCGKYPALKAESQETAQKFLTTNKPIFDRVSLRLWELAEGMGMVNLSFLRSPPCPGTPHSTPARCRRRNRWDRGSSL